MRTVWAFVTLLCLAITIAGCGRTQRKQVIPVVATTEDGSAFPASLAGRWKADRHGWEFVLEPDGWIASAVISLGRVTVLPGQTATIPTKTGEPAIFAPGPWAVHYDPATRMLTIKIAMEHVRIPMGDNLLEGSSTDIFTGIVSPAMDAWQTEWTTFTDYTAQTPESQSIDLSTDKTYGETQLLVFAKVAE